MIYHVFAVQDLKAGFFMPPFMFASVGQAVRACIDEASRPESMLARHPADFALYHIGYWNDANGLYDQKMAAEHLGSFVSFVKDRAKYDDLFDVRTKGETD